MSSASSASSARPGFGLGDPPGRPRQANLVVAALLVAVATPLVSPWRMVDPDALSRLAIGRAIAQARSVPHTDPFTFPAPERRWTNPEWLGDVIIYSIYSTCGESGLQLCKATVITGGMLLVLLLAVRAGALPLVAAGLLLLLLPGCVPRFTLRNQIHQLWLVPLYGLVVLRAGADRRWLLALLPLGALWANLHASFPLGWLVLGGGLVQAAVERRRPLVGALGVVLLVHPALALVNPHGIHVYDQVLDHLLGAPIYRELIVEWQAPAGVSRLPLLLMTVVGVASFLPRANRRQAGAALLLLAGLALAHSSQRFMPLLAVLGVPAVAANLTRYVADTSPRFRRLAVAGLALTAAGLVAPVVWAARTDHRPHVLRRPDAPLAAAARLARGAPAGSRLFAPYNAGPWLLWLGRGRVRLYVDPRNNLGAGMLHRYVHHLLPDPGHFEAEVGRYGITLCLVDLEDRRMAVLAAHLRRSPGRWRRLGSDGRFALYAVRSPGR
jgi:hypothetical protein